MGRGLSRSQRERQSWNSNPAIIAPSLLVILFFVTVFQQALFYIIFLLNMAIEVGVEIVINMANHCLDHMLTKVRSDPYCYCSALSNQESSICV